MEKIFETARKNQSRARAIIKETDIKEIWKSFGFEAHLVGSLETGLLVKHRDIDFHIYSNIFSLANNFAAIAELAKNKRIKRIEYLNLLDTDEMCLEWHAWYLDEDNELWQIDMIYILKDSPYAGKFEQAADRIKAALTPETKEAILKIKYEIPEDKKIMGIDIYQAVIEDGVRNYSDFLKWKETHRAEGINMWTPKP